MIRAAAVVALPLAFGACSWFTDFKEQPKPDPWETASDTIGMRGNPQFSVPVTGTALAAYEVSYNALPGVIDSIGARVQNPTPVSDSSLANGHRYYQINCAVCHGDAGQGNGPATKYGMPGINLLGDITKGRSDGYIWGIIRNGRGLMPSYGRIEEMDRWDVVNYVRGLQGQLGRTVATGPLGYPGQGGSVVPTYTRMAPTRSVPFYKHGPADAHAGATPGLSADTRPGAALPDTTVRTEQRDGSTPVAHPAVTSEVTP